MQSGRRSGGANVPHFSRPAGVSTVAAAAGAASEAADVGQFAHPSISVCIAHSDVGGGNEPGR